MPYTAITKPNLGDPTKLSFANALIDNDAFFQTEISAIRANQVPNGSFELPAGGTGTPDRWIKTENSGWTIAQDSADSVHGKISAKFTTPGSTVGIGAILESSDYFETSANTPVNLEWEQQSSVAAIRVRVILQWFDGSLVSQGATTIYDSTANPIAWAKQAGAATPPAAAKLAKINIQCDDSGNTTAGNVRFDAFAFKTSATIGSIIVLTESGSWTVPNGATKIRVRCWGGGSSTGPSIGGAGGGYGEDVFSVTPGTVYTVTIGAGGTAAGNGGTTSLGSLISASGGVASPTAGGTSSAIINVTGGRGSANVGGAAGGGGGLGGTGNNNGGDPGGGSGPTTFPAAPAGGKGRIIIEY